MSARSRISWSAILFPLGAVLAVIIICGGLYMWEADQIEKNMRDREARRVENFSNRMGENLQAVITELRVLADGDGLQAYLAGGKQADLERAIHRAVFISRLKPDYDQVRYLDEHGQEIVRVNQNGMVVPHDRLQNKADRPYFLKASALAPGQVYISAFDLNVENGRIEQPLKPMIRLAVPVFDTAGHRRGIYIINYLGANLLTRLQQSAPQFQQRFRLLNAQGYWLKAAQPDREWGFMFPDRSGMTMARTDPDFWKQVENKPLGQMRHDGGLFTWYRFVPDQMISELPDTLVVDEPFLIMAAEVSPKEWTAYYANSRITFLVIGGILLLLIAVSWRSLEARQRAQHERDRFFNLTRDMLCIAGFDGYFKRLNPSWEKTLGFSNEELFSRPFIDFVHPEDREKTLKQIEALSHGQETISFENRYCCKDGSYRWFLWSSRPLVNERLIFASARDLTNYKKAEETLIKSRQMFQKLFENAPDAIVMVDRAGSIVRVNAQTETLFGFSRNELIGRNMDALMPERYRSRHGGHLAAYFAAPHPRAAGEGGLELVALHKDGSEFSVDIMLSSLETDEGLHALAVIRDITARKRAEEHIKKLNEDLKERAKQLETSNKELEAFSYSVSHDLRAPLRHVDGFVEMMSKNCAEKLDDRGRRYLNIIADSARQMGVLIDDLLVFSRMGRAEMQNSQVNINTMVRETVDAMKVEINGRHVVWDIKPMPEVKADAAMLRQVWVNLIGNAVKYTRPRDPAKIEVDCFDPATTNGEYVFYVRDNGVGFDMQYVDKLFGVFQRLHRTNDFEGTGIGLANVRRIVSRHGGRAWAEGKINEGATFFFSLPKTPPEPKG